MGIDLGATWLRVCRVGFSDAAVLRFRTPAGCNAGDQLSRELARLLPAGMSSLRIGLARAPGVDAAGTVTAWPSRPDWVNVELLQAISSTASVRACSADDGVCAALWEHLAHRRERRCGWTTACVTVGTGVGIGVVRDGMPLSTGDGANTIAHLPLGAPDAVCACGRTGCLQATLSARALRQNLESGNQMNIVRVLRRLLTYLQSRYEVQQVVLTGGGLQGAGACPLVAVAAREAAAPQLRMSATPALSALGGALVLAAGPSPDGRDVIARIGSVLQRWQTLMSVAEACR